MKKWLSPWLVPLVILGSVFIQASPVAGAIWIATSLVLVRLLNGHFALPPSDGPLRRPYDDPTRSYLGAFVGPSVRSRS
jgi:hypothetical protein